MIQTTKRVAIDYSSEDVKRVIIEHAKMRYTRSGLKFLDVDSIDEESVKVKMRVREDGSGPEISSFIVILEEIVEDSNV